MIWPHSVATAKIESAQEELAMNIQEIVVVAAVVLAAAYWLSAFVKMGRGSGKGCGSGCGKCGEPPVETSGGRIKLL